MTAAAGPLRTTPLPVRVDQTEGSIVLYVGDRKVASAWGPAVDDPDAWFLWNGYSDPYRISGGREGAAGLIEHRQDEWLRREGSLWHPDHGPIDETGYVAVAPTGIACVGCGDDQCGDTCIAIVEERGEAETTRHYLCANCASFFDGEDDA